MFSLQILQVTSNGLITLGAASFDCCPVTFDSIPPDATPFVAPYWVDNDPSTEGNVSYEVHGQRSPLLQDISEFISRNQSTVFSGVWMLIASWRDLPEFSFEDLVSTYVYDMEVPATHVHVVMHTAVLFD